MIINHGGILMKESRIIIFLSVIILIALISIFYIGLDNELCMNIATNLFCGVIVALVTAICQYFSSKRKIINDVYDLYFDLYRTYYYAKNKTIFFHINAYSICKKIMELSPKVYGTLECYHGFFKEKDSLYMKMNPIIQLNQTLKAKNTIKTLYRWFNKKLFN